MRRIVGIHVVSVLLLLGAIGCQKQEEPKKKANSNHIEAPSKPETANTEKRNNKPDKESETEEMAQENLEADFKPKYKVDEQYFIKPIGDANPNIVLLTIDDAPDQHALEMAEILKEKNASAIFFVNGHLINSSEKEDVIKKIHGMGFLIGNHTYSHRDLSELSPKEQREEIVSVNEMIEKITGEKPKYFRAPFGSNTEVSRKIANEENMIVMNWTYGYDWEKDYMNHHALAEIMVETDFLVPGANLLMHDRKWTSEGLAEIITGLRGKGFEILNPIEIETSTAEKSE